MAIIYNRVGINFLSSAGQKHPTVSWPCRRFCFFNGYSVSGLTFTMVKMSVFVHVFFGRKTNVFSKKMLVYNEAIQKIGSFKIADFWHPPLFPTFVHSRRLAFSAPSLYLPRIKRTINLNKHYSNMKSWEVRQSSQSKNILHDISISADDL